MEKENLMIRFFTLTTLLLSFSVGCHSKTSITTDESIEPPLEYSINIGEQTITISEDETIQLDGVFTNPKLTVTPSPYRVFPYQGITFKYPRSFTFEANLKGSITKNWILSGNDFKIMVFDMSASVTTSDFADSMVGKFGRDNAEIVNTNKNITLGKHKLSGTSIKASVVKHQILIDIYLVSSSKSKTKLLVFQDNINKADNQSKESKEVLALIKESFDVQ